MLPQEIVKALVNMGLKEQQAKSTTAEEIVKMFLDNDGVGFIELMKATESGYNELSDRLEELKIAVNSITEFQKDMTPTAKNIIAVYSAIASINYSFLGVNGTEAIRNTTPVVLSYISLLKNSNNEEQEAAI